MKIATPVLTFSRAALKDLDRRAVDEFHIPILTLMENAGRAVAEVAQRHLRLGKSALIFCGPGNNGGDGLVAARHLANAGIPVQVLLLSDALSPAPAAQLQIVHAMKLPVKTESPDHSELRNWIVESDPADIVIDALFGTGLSRPPEGLAADVIHALNSSHRTIISVDIPSGLDADTGKPLAPDSAIRATETVSFCGLKLGFGSAPAYTGKISIADIGAPLALLRQLARP